MQERYIGRQEASAMVIITLVMNRFRFDVDEREAGNGGQ